MEEFTITENPIIGETNFLMKQIEKTLQLKVFSYIFSSTYMYLLLSLN
jgi:hypothetical protein